jgi:two-component system, LytTR family, response regulator
MSNVVIIDDEKEARRNLRQLLNLSCPSAKIVGEASGVEEGIEVINQTNPDAIFLDIQMDDGSGFDLLKYFPEPQFQVVFVTAYDQFAIKAFECNAIDYLLKPINTDRLISSIKKVEQLNSRDQYFKQLSSLMDNIYQHRFETITLQTQEGQHYVRLENIIRLEADKGYSTFHCKNRKEIVVSKTIKKFEELLPEDDFFRTHQSHIINRKFVKSYINESGGFIKMEDGYQVPIARRNKDPFFNWMRKEE